MFLYLVNMLIAMPRMYAYVSTCTVYVHEGLETDAYTLPKAI